jgi:hypothetical protein|tara:strand:+ start:36 stop:236 length:201 start_codon:yes stop_codon:yes gene_type:complete
MSTKGTAAKSASGAAMSKYDVEVEARLKALEAKASTPAPAAGDEKLNKLIGILKSAFPQEFKNKDI